jgi:hypothetical protein
MSRLKREETLTHKVTQQRNIEAKSKKCNFGGFLGQKEAGALLPRERSIIALCAKTSGALALC